MGTVLRSHLRVLKDIHTNPFYRPLWRRALIVLITGGWAVFEFWQGGSGLWTALFAAAFVFCVWSMFITYPKEP